MLHRLKSGAGFVQERVGHGETEDDVVGDDEDEAGGDGFAEVFGNQQSRSEERRVGKECRL